MVILFAAGGAISSTALGQGAQVPLTRTGAGHC